MMNGLVEHALSLTPDEVEQARQRAQERNDIRAEAQLPTIPMSRAVTEAWERIEGEKQLLVFQHVKARISDRFYRRVERIIEKRTGRAFRFNHISGLAVQDRWLGVLDRFVEREVRRHYRGQPIPLDELRQLYGD